LLTQLIVSIWLHHIMSNHQNKKNYWLFYYEWTCNNGMWCLLPSLKHTLSKSILETRITCYCSPCFVKSNTDFLWYPGVWHMWLYHYISTNDLAPECLSKHISIVNPELIEIYIDRIWPIKWTDLDRIQQRPFYRKWYYYNMDAVTPDNCDVCNLY